MRQSLLKRETDGSARAARAHASLGRRGYEWLRAATGAGVAGQGLFPYAAYHALESWKNCGGYNTNKINQNQFDSCVKSSVPTYQR
ncbi:hypothetical protein EVAR_35989_1 [Eumeta japonica]|uniref:Uncharacterized protein n=1 Tax=Eumeta variegata TaxID=151549 RepID=A0A4C1WUX8_EUMVA|nr:hypothetical protein EVAR_35989_1 [Eumeta japonica]